MKNTLKFFGILFMSLVLVTSCEEKDDELTRDGYRIKEIFMKYDVESSSKTTFIYDGNKLITKNKIYYYLNEETSQQKTTFTYLDNRISEVINVAKRESLYDKKEYVLENGLVKSETKEYSNGNKNTTKYEYNGKNLTKIIYNDGGYDAFIYENGRIVARKKFYDNGLLMRKWTLDYTGDKLMKITYYRGNDVSSKLEYKYSDNKVSEIAHYSFYDNKWELWGQTTNKYNNKGLLIETKHDVIGNKFHSFKTTYKYEVGKGNAKLFEKSEIALLRDELVLQWVLN